MCMCVEGYKAVAGWLEVESGGEDGAASGVDNSTCARQTKKMYDCFRSWGCLFIVWRVLPDWRLYLLRGWLSFERQLEDDGGQASYSLLSNRVHPRLTALGQIWTVVQVDDGQNQNESSRDFYYRRNHNIMKPTISLPCLVDAAIT